MTDRVCSVLLVDDSEDATFFLSSLLSLHGFEVAVAHTGAAALALTTQRRFDAVLLDLSLPDMLGCGLAAQLVTQHRASGASTPRLLALSGHSPDSASARPLLGLVESYLAKPVDVDALVAALSTASA